MITVRLRPVKGATGWVNRIGRSGTSFPNPFNMIAARTICEKEAAAHAEWA